MMTPASGGAKTYMQAARLAAFILQRVSARRKLRRLKPRGKAIVLAAKDGVVIDTREAALKQSIDALIDAVLAYT